MGNVNFWMAVLCGLSIAIQLIPEEQGLKVRQMAYDAAFPGQRLVGLVLDRIRASLHENSSEFEKELVLREALINKQALEIRQLQLLSVQKANDSIPENTDPLFHQKLVSARIIGKQTRAQFRDYPIVTFGNTSPGLFVVEGDVPLIDQGTPEGLTPGDLVASGRTVVGRLAAVGRWTSSIRLVTDAEFATPVKLFRVTKRGLIAGPSGSVQGGGKKGCILNSIPYTEGIEVGDLVFTDERDGVSPERLYIGKVSFADLERGALTWNALVEPEAELEDLIRVYVLKTELNLDRLNAN